MQYSIIIYSHHAVHYVSMTYFVTKFVHLHPLYQFHSHPSIPGLWDSIGIDGNNMDSNSPSI